MKEFRMTHNLTNQYIGSKIIRQSYIHIAYDTPTCSDRNRQSKYEMAHTTMKATQLLCVFTFSFKNILLQKF